MAFLYMYGMTNKTKRLNFTLNIENDNVCFSIGRKKTLCTASVVQVASALGAAWAPNFVIYVILEFVIGAACHGVFMCCCVLGEPKLYN